MSDQLDRAIRDLVGELADSRPPVDSLLEPPTVVRFYPGSRRRWRGPALAVAVFVALAGIGLGVYLASGSRPSGRDVAAVEETTALPGGRAISVPVDGATLQGVLVPGDTTGMLVVPSYATPVADLEPLLLDLVATGHTVMAVDLRGSGASDGAPSVADLPWDVVAAVAELRRSGVERVVLLGYRHGGTATLVAAQAAGADAVIAYFPFPQYQGLDATTAVRDSTVPTLFISDPTHQLFSRASWAVELWRIAGGPADYAILPMVPDGADTLRFYTPLMVSHATAFLSEHLDEG